MFHHSSFATERPLRSPTPQVQEACRLAISLVAGAHNLKIRHILSTQRGPVTVARARQLSMYLAHVALGCSLTDIGAAFERDRTTVSHACHVIEDMRDDPVFDREVCAYEKRLETMGGRPW
jgi:chromosomal replication initiation ATPase DnaA